MPFNILITLFVLSSIVDLVLSSRLCAQVGIQDNLDFHKTYTAPGGSDDNKESSPSSPDRAAEIGLRNMHRLGPGSPEDNAYARALGFTSAEEAGRAELGSPLSIHMINLGTLKDYSEKSRPEDLTNFTRNLRRMIYPLLVDGNLRSSLTVAEDRKTKRWQTIAWGSPKLIELLEKNRQPGSNMVLLISPQNPLGLRFIGEKKEGELLFAPIADIPRLNLKAGRRISAHNLFILLKTVANDYSKQSEQ